MVVVVLNMGLWSLDPNRDIFSGAWTMFALLILLTVSRDILYAYLVRCYLRSPSMSPSVLGMSVRRRKICQHPRVSYHMKTQ